MRGSILLVDDDVADCKGLSKYLEDGGFLVESTRDYEQAAAFLRSWIPDLVLLSWLIRGTSAAKWLRAVKTDGHYNQIPIILIAEKANEEERIWAFDVGVDDFLIKPCSPPELLARVRAVLRRSPTGRCASNSLEVNGIRLEPLEQQAFIGTRQLALRPAEFRLLEFFLTHLESACSRTQIVEQVWGGMETIDERTVDVHVMRLRKILASFGQGDLIQTVRGFGYRCSVARVERISDSGR